MQNFVDETVIEVSSGNGGAGSVSFRREKYVPKGGPDGGDGGKGGDVVFVVQENLKTLSHLKFKRVFHAGNGEQGHGRKKHGRDGVDIEITVPPGTSVRDQENGEVLRDLTEPGERWLFLRGGRGGQGNSHFATSRHQTPRFAQPGMPGDSARLLVELKLIADIGFVGLPNAGKSTLLSVLTNARPKVGAYPFTTKIPNLGVLSLGYRDMILADIPGIIEGASHGAGLGLRFLKHIARTFGIAYLLDLGDPDCIDSFRMLEGELASYSRELAGRRRILVGTKLDLPEAEDRLARLAEAYPDETVLGISAVTRRGIDELIRAFETLVRGSGREQDEQAESVQPVDPVDPVRENPDGEDGGNAQ